MLLNVSNTNIPFTLLWLLTIVVCCWNSFSFLFHYIISLSLGTSPVATQLPAGWEAIKDPTTGRLYYANKETGQTQWSLPTNARFTETPTRAPTGVLERRFDAVADTPLSTPMGKQVLSKVEEVDDDENGTWKNVSPIPEHRKTGTEQNNISVPATSVVVPASGYGSRLTVPTTVAASSSSDSSSGSNGMVAGVVSAVKSDTAATTAAEDSTLPLGWKALHDPSTGKTYYYSAFTGKTQWTRPTIPPAPPAASTPSTSNMPTNWKAINDPKSGRTYYYNSSTGVSQVFLMKRSIDILEKENHPDISHSHILSFTLPI